MGAACSEESAHVVCIFVCVYECVEWGGWREQSKGLGMYQEWNVLLLCFSMNLTIWFATILILVLKVLMKHEWGWLGLQVWDLAHSLSVIHTHQCTSKFSIRHSLQEKRTKPPSIIIIVKKNNLKIHINHIIYIYICVISLFFYYDPKKNLNLICK